VPRARTQPPTVIPDPDEIGTQLAPDIPAPKKPSHAASTASVGHSLERLQEGVDPETAALAAEVAAVALGKNPGTPPPPPSSDFAHLPLSDQPVRPKVIRMPSEQYLSNASAELEKLPVTERAEAFRNIVDHYRELRAREDALRKNIGP
jgi:hypothetical protein